VAAAWSLVLLPPPCAAACPLVASLAAERVDSLLASCSHVRQARGVSRSDSRSPSPALTTRTGLTTPPPSPHRDRFRRQSSSSIERMIEWDLRNPGFTPSPRRRYSPTPTSDFDPPSPPPSPDMADAGVSSGAASVSVAVAAPPSPPEMEVRRIETTVWLDPFTRVWTVANGLECSTQPKWHFDEADVDDIHVHVKYQKNADGSRVCTAKTSVEMAWGDKWTTSASTRRGEECNPDAEGKGSGKCFKLPPKGKGKGQ